MPQIPVFQSRQRVPVAETGGAISLSAAGNPAAAFEQGAEKVLQVADKVATAEANAVARYHAGEEAVERARDEGRFIELTTAALRKRETEGDLSKLDELESNRQEVAQTYKEIVAGHRGGDESRQKLAVSLEGRRIAALTAAATASAKAKKAVLNSITGVQLRDIAADAFGNPGNRAKQLQAWDNVITNFSASLTPEDEFDFLERGRAEITKAHIEGYMARGQMNKAREIMLDDPTVVQYITPSESQAYQRQFEEFDRKKGEAVRAAGEKLIAFETVVGRKPTLTERLKIAGVAPSEGKETLTQKIQATEAALGRPLTPNEKAKLVGLGGDGGGASMSDVGGIRKEFTAQSKDFVSVRDSYARIEEVKTNPSAAGDLALIFNFMKMLDPGSTVRESEFANAQNAAGIPDRIRNIWNRAKSGERLADGQRDDFVSQAEGLMRAQRGKQLELETQYKGIAERGGINPADVVIDYQGPYRKGGGGSSASGGGGQTRVEYDLQGKPINSDNKDKKVKK